MRWRYMVGFSLGFAGAALQSCAEPVLEDPPSNLPGAGTGGAGTGGSGPATGGDAGSGVAGIAGVGNSFGGASGASNVGGSTGPGTGGSGTGGTGTGGETAGSGGDGASGGSAGGVAGSGGGSAGMLGEVWREDFEADSVGAGAINWVADSTALGWEVMSGNTQFLSHDSENSSRGMIGSTVGDWADVSVSADVRLTGGGDSTEIYLAAHVVPRASDFDYYYVYVNGRGEVRMGTTVGGSTSELGGSKVATNVFPASGTAHTLTLTVTGTTLTMAWDGQTRGTETVGNVIASGAVGLGIQEGKAAFDNIVVSTP